MRKHIKRICSFLMVLTTVLMAAVVWGFYFLPDEIYTVNDEKIGGKIFTYSIENQSQTASRSVTLNGQYKVNVSLFNSIPVKSSKLNVSKRQYLVPSGEIVGLRLFTKGVMIVGVDSVDTSSGQINAGEIAGLKKGDVIIKIDGTEIKNSAQVDNIILKSDGKALNIAFTRNGKEKNCVLIPVYSVSGGRYKTGLWIRDSAAGIGTMTFYEPSTGFFACLGHAVCDIDTGEVLPFSDGDIVDAEICGCVKGKNGKAGELCGVFRQESEGILLFNNPFGVFGYLNESDNSVASVPVATKSEVKPGSAQIISTVEGDEKSYYSIEIEKLSMDNKEGKNFTLKITDDKLLEKTGGIVQGMSGSPIIQNGRLVGAVTHVFVNDPSRGYGIFIGNMLDSAA